MNKKVIYVDVGKMPKFMAEIFMEELYKKLITSPKSSEQVMEIVEEVLEIIQ